MNDEYVIPPMEGEGQDVELAADPEKEALIQQTIRLEKDAARWKREKTALRDMERRYLALVDVPFLVFVILCDGRVKYLNRKGEELFGFSLREKPKFDFMDYVAPGYCDSVERLLVPAEDAPIWNNRLSFPIVSVDGLQKWLDFAVTPTEYQGEPVLLGVGYEITAPCGTAVVKQACDGFTLEDQRDVLLCVLDDKATPMEMTDGFRSLSADIWGKIPERGVPLSVLFPDDARSDAFRFAMEKALAGERTEVGHEAQGRFFSMVLSPLYDGAGAVTGATLALSDKTEERRLQRAIRSGEEAIRRLIAVVPQPMAVFSADRAVLLECNGPFLARIGSSRDDVTGKHVDDLLPALGEQWANLASATQAEGILRDFAAKAGGESLIVTAGCVDMAAGRGIVVVLHDAAQKRSAVVEDRRGADTDPLLGIPSRKGFEQSIATETERARRYRGSLALILLDVDRFKSMKEGLGQEVAEKMLKELRATVKSRVRSTDFLGRWGEDQFAILTPMSGYLAHQTADKIRDMIRHYQFIPDRIVTCSFGVCEFRKGMTDEEFMQKTEDALAEAKRAGGNKVVLSPLMS